MAGAEFLDSISGLPSLGLDTLRLLLALALVLLPGLVLGSTLTSRSTGALVQLAWGIGAWFACLILGSLTLNALHALHIWGWLIWMLGVLLVALSIRLLHPRAAVAPLEEGQAPGGKGFEISHLWMMVAAIGIAVGAVATARMGVYEASGKPSTEIWALPTNDNVSISLRNREGRPMVYRIDVLRGMDVVEAWDTPELLPGEVHQHPLRRRNYDDLIEPVPLRVVLYRAGEYVPYRHLTLAH
jgi:hypothetical protein